MRIVLMGPNLPRPPGKTATTVHLSQAMVNRAPVVHMDGTGTRELYLKVLAEMNPGWLPEDIAPIGIEDLQTHDLVLRFVEIDGELFMSKVLIP